ncbi:MAG: hypothetical protein QXG00_03695 [Candidatus Woesearchaeota archaeon]
MGNDIITIRNADRNLWIDFVAKCKKSKKNTWEVLEPMLKEFIKKN